MTARVSGPPGFPHIPTHLNDGQPLGAFQARREGMLGMLNIGNGINPNPRQPRLIVIWNLQGAAIDAARQEHAAVLVGQEHNDVQRAADPRLVDVAAEEESDTLASWYDDQLATQEVDTAPEDEVQP